MFRKRKIEIQLPAQTVIDCLKSQLRVRIPTGWVREDSFCLYKRVGSSEDNRFGIFCFTGSIEEKSNGMQVVYQVRPDILSCVFLAIFAAVAVYAIISLIAGVGNVLITVLTVAFNGFMWLLVLWQKHMLVERFKTKLLNHS